LARRRIHGNGRCDGQLTGIQNDLFRPFARRLDPDNRSIEGDRLISEYRWGPWQEPAGDEQQSRKGASDEDKIAGYRQRSSLRKIEQFRLTCSLDEGAAVMDTGLTLVRNATKQSTPMANVAKLNTLLMSAPVPFPFRADAAGSTPRHVASRRACFDGRNGTRLGVTDGAGSAVGCEEGKAYSAAIMFDFKSMPSAFATPAP
jgi:hypothetical protein